MSCINDTLMPSEPLDLENPPRCQYCGKAYHPLTVKLFGKDRDVWSVSCGCYEKRQREAGSYEVDCRICGAVATATMPYDDSPMRFVDCPSCGAYYGERMAKREAKAYRIPITYADADLSWYTEAKDWVEHPTDGLLFTGSTGTGKTWAACAVLKAWADEGRGKAVFCRAAEIIDAAHDAFGTNTKADVLKDYTEPSILLIDDLGKENPTEFAVELMFRVLNERADAGKPTIVTTNYDADGLFSRLSSRSKDEVTAAAIVSRLGAFTAIHAIGDDRRLA